MRPASEDDGTDDITDGLVQQFKRTEWFTLLFKLGELSDELIDLMLYAF